MNKKQDLLKQKLSKLNKKIKELSLMFEISKKIASMSDLQDILEVILDKTVSALKCEIGSILLLDEETGYLTIKVAKGLSEDIIKNTRLKIGERISGWVAEHRRAILVKNIEKDKRFKFRSLEKYYTKSLISAPIEVKNKIVGVINLNNKKSRESFNVDDLSFLRAVASECAIAIENAYLYESLQELYMRIIRSLAVTIDTKDRYTQSHSTNVTKYAVAIAEEMGFSEKEIDEIKKAAQLHDIGKIGVHDYILTKIDKLTSEELDEIKSHPQKSAEILEPLVFLNGVISIIRSHHERYDGKGYPEGIAGDKIPLGARILAVADAYDAMTSDRPYRKALTEEQAVEELKINAGKQFDPEIVNIFLKILAKKKESV